MLKQFLQRKQEASGYPSFAKDPESKAKYIQDYYAREGDPVKSWKKSLSTKRYVASASCCLILCGISFSMQENQPTCELATDPELFDRYLHSEQYDGETAFICVWW